MTLQRGGKRKQDGRFDKLNKQCSTLYSPLLWRGVGGETFKLNTYAKNNIIFHSFNRFIFL